MMQIGRIAYTAPTEFDHMVNAGHPQFKTEVREVRYDFKRRIGFVYMGWTCCVDMNGAVTFFEALDPNVQMIVTLEGVDDDGSTDYHLDTCYFKVGKRNPVEEPSMTDKGWNAPWGAFIPNGADFLWGASCEGLDQGEVTEAWGKLASLPELQAVVMRNLPPRRPRPHSPSRGQDSWV